MEKFGHRRPVCDNNAPMGRRDRQSAVAPLSAELERMFGSRRMSAGLSLGRVLNVWRKVVGKKVAEAATPVWFEGGELRIATKHSVWANELQLMSEALKRSLNEEIGEELVESVSVYVGKMPSGDQAET